MIQVGRRRLQALALAVLSAPGVAAREKPARIVILSRSAFPEGDLQFLRDGLRDLGHVEGRSYVIELRDAGGDARNNDAPLRELAVKVAGSKPAIIFAAQGQAAQAAKAATSTIPIVFSALDPVKEGLVASLARPGGNATGLVSPINAKRLEILREAFPALIRLAFLYVPDSPGSLAQLEGFKAAANTLGIELLPISIRGDAELGTAIEEAARLHAEGLAHISTPLFLSYARQWVALAAKHRLAIVTDVHDAVEAGALIAYAHDRRARMRSFARFLDRILKGASPADLPVELPTHFELWINLRTARALGLTIPPALLARADRIIE